MHLPFERLVHIGIVVRDAEKTARNMARIYGISKWSVVENTGARLSRSSTHGFAAQHDYLTATGSAPTQGGDVTFQLIQPRGGWTTFEEFALTRGEGIHHICTAQLDPKRFAELEQWLQREGLAIAQHDCIDGVLDRYLIDTREALGGFYVAIDVVSSADPAPIAPDRIWDFADAVPVGGYVLPLTGARQHFGVVVFDLMDRVAQWTRLTGVTEWRFSDWHTAPDSLENPTYMGQPVDHAYFTTMVQFNDLLGFEIIQPTFGPSHYRENYRDALGEGIHHVSTTFLPSRESFERAAADMAAAGAPVVMSGGIGRGFVHFYYLDTREALAGYVTEVLHPGEHFADGPVNIRPAMVADLSTAAT